MPDQLFAAGLLMRRSKSAEQIGDAKAHESCVDVNYIDHLGELTEQIIKPI